MSHATAAAKGRYGATPFDPAEPYAKALIADIKAHLPEVDYFQREDLLHLPCFQGVATITRYRYVCIAVGLLVRQGKLIAKGRTDLCLPSKQSRYDSEESLSERYGATIRRLVISRIGAFTVMDVVTLWRRSDQHLTDNTKRVAVRGTLRELAREGKVEVDGYLYSMVRGKGA